jgi:hypothetical protein
VRRPTAAAPLHPLARLAHAGLLTAVVDGTFSSLLSRFAYRSTVTRLFQGVAATALGPRALQGGRTTAAIGVLMHCGVAFGWSAVFLLVVLASARVRGALASRYGAVRIAAVFGPGVWVVMSLGVIPFVTGRAPSITGRWWIQFFGHMPFVGLPIVTSIGRGSRPES